MTELEQAVLDFKECRRAIQSITEEYRDNKAELAKLREELSNTSRAELGRLKVRQYQLKNLVNRLPKRFK